MAKAKPVKAADLAIKALKPRATRYEVPVEGNRGLVVTVWPSGEKAWTYRGRIRGVLYREKIGVYPAMPLASALKAFADLREQRHKGEDLPARRQRATQTEKRSPTVKTLCHEYIERHAKPNKRSWQQDKRMLDKDVIPSWGRLRAAGIERADVVALLDTITDRNAAMQAGKVLALVRKVWNFGIDRGVLTSNPASRIPRPVKARTINRVLSDIELKKVWPKFAKSGLRPQVGAAMQLQLLTGQRIGEVLQAEWSEIDLAAQTWLIPATKSKNKREHLVPLSAQAKAIIEAQPQAGRFIFPGRGEAAIRSEVAAHELAEAFPALGVAKFTTHDLRRTVETRMASIGIGKETRDRVLNHTDRSVGGMHYNRYDYLPEKRAALDKWGKLLGEIIEGKHIGNVVQIKRRARQESGASR
jgi:integrase